APGRARRARPRRAVPHSRDGDAADLRGRSTLACDDARLGPHGRHALFRRAHGPRLFRSPLWRRLSGARAHRVGLMRPTNLDRALRHTFRFDASDLAANREGRLSPRQTALVGAGRAGMWLALGIFPAVMVGSIGLVAFFNWRLHSRLHGPA